MGGNGLPVVSGVWLVGKGDCAGTEPSQEERQPWEREPEKDERCGGHLPSEAAAASFPSTLSSIQWGSHHSMGFTYTPETSMA